MPEKDKKFYIYLYYKLKLKRLFEKLSNDERKSLFNKIKENDDENELKFLNRYIEFNTENKTYFKFHIENMDKEDILFLINYIDKNFNIKMEENNS